MIAGMTIDLGDIIQIVIALAGFAAVGLVWYGRKNQGDSDQERRIKALEESVARQTNDAQLVARLEERINALTTQQTQLPAIIANSVAAGIREALGAVLQGARARAA